MNYYVSREEVIMINEVLVEKTLNEIADENNILLSATIEILNECNFCCEHCYHPQHNHKMNTDKVISLLEELKELGVLYLTLTGGEIFLHKDIMNIISYARRLGMSITLLTNIFLLNRLSIKQLSELFISEISTTLFSLDESINDNITKVPGSLKQIRENIKIIQEYGICLEIKTPIMRKNRGEAKK